MEGLEAKRQQEILWERVNKEIEGIRGYYPNIAQLVERLTVEE